MNLSSSFYFGILFLLKASIAQSAPHSAYPDEDEEALIDKLASLAAAVGPEAFLSSPPKQSRQEPLPQQPYLSPQNYDFAASYLASLGVDSPAAAASVAGLDAGVDFGGAEDSLAAREAALKLPREFGYKPNDLRFYLPADQFPPPEQQQELPPPPSKINSPPPPQPPQQQQRVPPPPQKEFEGQHEFVLGDDKSDFYFMKKKEQMGGGGGGDSVRSYVPGPSHIMASEHSAPYPGFSSSQINPDKAFSYSDMYYIAIVAGCSAAAVVGIIAAGICWYRIHERIKAAADVDYPAYGVTGPSKDITPSGGGDRKLAQSAQMYHYQHQKQQMAALQKGAIQGDRQGSGGSDVESDDDNEDGDYTVYECPGLAPAGEMEVKNPLFNDEQPTPSNGAKQQQQTSQPASQQQASSQQHQDSSSSPAADSASSSASSTATVTSTTPKVAESPKTPTPAAAAPPPSTEQQQQSSSSSSKKEKGKGHHKEK